MPRVHSSIQSRIYSRIDWSAFIRLIVHGRSSFDSWIDWSTLKSGLIVLLSRVTSALWWSLIPWVFIFSWISEISWIHLSWESWILSSHWSCFILFEVSWISWFSSSYFGFRSSLRRSSIKSRILSCSWICCSHLEWSWLWLRLI